MTRPEGDQHDSGDTDEGGSPKGDTVHTDGREVLAHKPVLIPVEELPGVFRSVRVPKTAD